MIKDKMIKFLPIGVVVLLFIGGLIYIRVSTNTADEKQMTPQLPTINSTNSTSQSLKSPTSPVEDRITTLETAVTYLLQNARSSGETNEEVSQTIANGDPLLENRLKLLETSVAELKVRLTPTPLLTPTVTSTKPPLYIPLGSSLITDDQNGLPLDTFEVSIDTADYPGYSAVVLEVITRLLQQNGSAIASLYNTTDGIDISGSSITNTTDSFKLLSSSPFKLTAGKKNYRLKAKSTNGADMSIQMARLKVLF